MKLGSVEDKKAVMSSKNKLAGSQIYIMHDISYEERKKQEEIIKWVKLIRSRGGNAKVGTGRVGVNNIWINWEDKEALKKVELDLEECNNNNIANANKVNLDEKNGEGDNNVTEQDKENFA